MNGQDREWSRSRYWLGHFLYSRHERHAVAWNDHDACIDPAAAGPAPLARWLARRHQAQRITNDSGIWLIQDALRRHPHDPAYIQSLRLIARENREDGEMIDRLMTCLGLSLKPRTGVLASLRRSFGRMRRPRLGSRFEMSLRLLNDLLDLSVLTMLHQVSSLCRQAPLQSVCKNLCQDKRAHIAFAAERLTMLYADFNFVRRNLRRLRLRLMWTAALLYVAFRHGELLRACGASPWGFVIGGYGRFSPLLERMVPYRRDALLAALLNQKQDPYAEPKPLAP